ncbi:MAG: CPBP family intramembrane metalloprotease [Planctomycetota bacterium]|nr:CPBP family intramembrane metalloprotease [Planctomycetota bacterium]
MSGTQPSPDGNSSGDSSGKGRAFLALLLLVPAPSLGALTAMRWLPGPAGQVVYGASKVWLILLPTFWYLRVDGGRPGASPVRRGGLGVGLVLGLLMGGVLAGAYFVLGDWLIPPADVEKVRGLAAEIGTGSPAGYLILTVYLCTVNAVLEEYVWRWFVFRKSEALVGKYAAVVLSALLFTVHHVFALGMQFSWKFTVVGSAGVFVGGLVWSWCYLMYRSIWPGFLSHAIVDVVVFAVGWALLFGESGPAG